MKIINGDNILFIFQYGFRKLHLTTLAPIKFTDSVRRYLCDTNYITDISVDLTKTFDTVDTEKPLYKLGRYSIRGHVNDF